MAALAPALFTGFSGGVAATAAAAGTGAWAAGSALTFGSLLSTASTVLSIGSTIAGGKAESDQLKFQAQTEKFNATNREIERKRNLIRALATQNVRGAAGGIGTGGSLAAIQASSVRDFELDQSTDKAGTDARVTQLRQNASNASTFSLLSAAGTAVDSFDRSKKRGSV